MIPGPKSRKLMAERKKNVSNGIPASTPIFIKSGNGALIHDVDGNTFIDFSGGIGATNIGHSNSKVVGVVKNQAEKFFHSCFQVVGYEAYIQLAKKLNRITPGKFAKKTALFNSGAEAVENAVKIARKFTGRGAIISFEEGFHGRTLLALGLTGKVTPYKLGFGPFPSEIYKLHYPDLYRKPHEMDEEQYTDFLLDDLENDFFKAVVDPKNVAALVMELVTGEGGFLIPPKRYVLELKKICKENGILFIADEVQTGFGRTGKIFASEHFGIEPDLICMAKSLSNGLPLSAVTGRKEIMDCVQEGGIGGTFVGNPLSCVSALETIKFIEKRKLWIRAREIGNIVMERFEKLKEDTNVVGDARGLGAMCSLEIVKDKVTREPDKEKTKKIVKKCYENGLVILSAGLFGNCIRTLMPLVIKDEELKGGLSVLEKIVKEEDEKK
ncbi:4-aminobutyrate--2-oxoglutarate transaminase [Candidatus Micrarchaeota archaeon]|nr:4-aminobutyrate--2-oxoglutarate transaminase [Candidatus Micrarchaeota archaeon]